MIQFTGDNLMEVLRYLYPLLQKGWNISYSQSLINESNIRITKENNTALVEVGYFIKFNADGDVVIYDTDPTIPLKPKPALKPDMVIEFERLINIFLGESVRLDIALDIIAEIMDKEIRLLKNDRIHIDEFVANIKFDDVSESIVCFDIKTVEK